jgi:hypothetical protein
MPLKYKENQAVYQSNSKAENIIFADMKQPGKISRIFLFLAAASLITSSCGMGKGCDCPRFSLFHYAR